jgi:sodium-dependent dicarboxylate transporter 2/3/5
MLMSGEQPRAPWARVIGLVAGAACPILTLTLESPWPELAPVAWRTLGLAGLMAIWWVGEVIPIAATGLLPLLVMPLMGIADLNAAAAPYANPVIYLYLGGFMLGLAIERWSLHTRIALGVMRRVGTRPDRLIGGMMLVTAFLSMWMSNTATAVMMLPIGLSVIALVESDTRSDFARALLLGIAYAASIGGLATLIGTPPNALMAAYLSETYGLTIGFAPWMVVALPISAILLVAAYFWLTRVAHRMPDENADGLHAMIGQRLSALGRMQPAERIVAGVFAVTAIAWMIRPLLVSWTGLPISDTTIALVAAMALFVLPADLATLAPVLDWDTAKRAPWGVLVLFGGGLSLAEQLQASGLAEFIGGGLAATQTLPLFVVVGLTTTAIVVLTEVTSNTATTASFLPILAPIGVAMGQGPLTLAVPVALAASCAFMLPAATPPNAIVFSSGHLRVSDMARAGLALNVAGIVVITATAMLLADVVFGG